MLDQKKEQSRKRSWQAFVFFVASLKYYSLSCIVSTSTIYRIIQRDTDETPHYVRHTESDINRNTWVFLLGLLVFGQLFDNMKRKMRRAIITIELCFGVMNLCLASLVYFFRRSSDATPEQINVHIGLTNILIESIQFLGAGIYLSSLL